MVLFENLAQVRALVSSLSFERNLETQFAVLCGSPSSGFDLKMQLNIQSQTHTLVFMPHALEWMKEGEAMPEPELKTGF